MKTDPPSPDHEFLMVTLCALATGIVLLWYFIR